MDFNFTNPNELSKAEFEEKRKFNSWEVYTEQQITAYGLEAANLMKKSLDNELTEDESYALKVAKAEIKGLTPMLVTDMIEGRITKSLFYVQDPQVRIIDTLEKSVDGTPIIKGVFLDTPVNRELNRVGKEFVKGTHSKKTVDDEMWKAIREKEEYKKACDYMSKGMPDNEVMENIKKAYPDVTDQDYKNFKKAYAREKHDEYMEKAAKMKKAMEDEDSDKEEQEDKETVQ